MPKFFVRKGILDNACQGYIFTGYFVQDYGEHKFVSEKKYYVESFETLKRGNVIEATEVNQNNKLEYLKVQILIQHIVNIHFKYGKLEIILIGGIILKDN